MMKRLAVVAQVGPSCSGTPEDFSSCQASSEFTNIYPNDAKGSSWSGSSPLTQLRDVVTQSSLELEGIYPSVAGSVYKENNPLHPLNESKDGSGHDNLNSRFDDSQQDQPKSYEEPKSGCYGQGKRKKPHGGRTLTVYYIRDGQLEPGEKDAQLNAEGIKDAINLRNWQSSPPGEGRNAKEESSPPVTKQIDAHLSSDTHPMNKFGLKLHIVSALQEIGVGIENTSVAEDGTRPDLTLSDQKCPLHGIKYEINAECNFGDQNKILERKSWIRLSPSAFDIGDQRLDDFCSWIIARMDEDVGLTDLILSGGSSWLKRFFIKKAGKWGEFNTVEEWLRKPNAELQSGGLLRFRLILRDGDEKTECFFERGLTHLSFGRIVEQGIMWNSEIKATTLVQSSLN